MEKLNTWVSVQEASDFSIYNLPFGIFSIKGGAKKIGIAIGDQVVDCYAAAEHGLFDSLDIPKAVFQNTYLNDFISLGKAKTKELRLFVQKALCTDSLLKEKAVQLLVPMTDVEMHLPVQIGDYTDFYSSIEHASNVGKMFRDPENALLPNWRHIPVGYHGRASSIIASGQAIKRPAGQIMPKGETSPIFSASKRLDFELEMGFIIGKSNPLGTPIKATEATDYIFGKVLFNDWSARDIQKWEYVPLGPFLGKNFASSISPWVVTLEALDPFKVAGPTQTPAVLPYLETPGAQNYDIKLEVAIQPKGSSETVISNSNFKYMYWNMAQQLAHHTVNGCNMNVGDMLASGTISGPTPDSYGSMLELSWSGSKPISLDDGSERTFLEDHDTVTMRGHCEKDGIRVGFGEVRTQILPN